MGYEKIKVLTTGGSIDKVYDPSLSRLVVGEATVVGILRAGAPGMDIQVEEVLRKDGLDMTEEDGRLLARKVSSDPCRRIVITHGTDSMVDTARALSEIEGKVVVITGAMQPSGYSCSDAAFNVGCAVAAVQALPQGVYVVMNGLLLNPQRTAKNPRTGLFEERDSN